MTRTDVKVNEIIANSLFRNAVHLIGTILIGYILLRLLLYILDVTQIGMGWLETHQDSGFLVIILILIFSLLIIDVCISIGRRRLGDEKYSLVESGISIARPGIERLHELPGIMKEKTGKGIPGADRPSGVPDSIEGKEPVDKEPTTLSRKTPELKPAVNQEVKRPVPSIEPNRPEVKQSRSFDEIIGEMDAEIKPEIKTKEAPGLEKPTINSEKLVPLEDVIVKPAPYKELKSNIKFFESVPIMVKEDKRVIKAFDSEHSINVIDFRSKITQKDVKITIELLKEHSVMAEPVIDGLVYEFDNIRINVPDEALDNLVIRFKIGREWITQNKIRTVQLEQFINGGWNIMTSKRIGQDAKYLFYEAHVSSLSVPFAIVGI